MSSLVGIIGEKPSLYSKSPAMWNAAFKALNIDAAYKPFDVPAGTLGTFVQSLKKNSSLKGFNVTMPYKVEIVSMLDRIDPVAEEIGAVNTVVRSKDGKLTGFNTDGQGVIDSLMKPWPGQALPFFPQLKGMTVFMIGAGGAARAAAFYLSRAIGASGRLMIFNRDARKSTQLTDEINQTFLNATAVPANQLSEVAKQANLIVNTTTVGQAGITKLRDGMATNLEPYSPLAASEPTPLHWDDFADTDSFLKNWFHVNAENIRANEQISMALMLSIPAATAFFDLIYAPSETRLLAQARESGKRTLNGARMIVWQAVDAFVNKIMLVDPPLNARVFDAMAAASV